tara:strand:+ start:183 stop:1379 length:1197 start_codon:yes stop_codon:yes gene_type:complete
MTVINPKSISGINSITTGSGSDDILTIHNNNGTERLRVDSTGATKITTGIVTTLTATTGIVTTLTTNTLTANSTAKVGSGVTLSPDGDVFATGVCTATSFVGDGSGLTNAGPSLTGSTNNTIVTVTGANAIQGESNLTFASDLLNISSTTQGLGARFTNTGNEYTNIQFSAARTAADNALGILNAKWDNNHEVAAIYLTTGDDTTNKDDGKIKFYTSAASGTLASRMEILNDGDVKVTDGDLVIGTSGHGIDFSAASGSAAGSTSALLDDYEQGSFTATCTNGVTLHSGTGDLVYYIKVGNLVTIQAEIRINNANSAADVTINNLPFVATDHVGNFCPGPVGTYDHPLNSGTSFAFVKTTKNTSTASFQCAGQDGTFRNLDAYGNGYLAFTLVYFTTF